MASLEMCDFLHMILYMKFLCFKWISYRCREFIFSPTTSSKLYLFNFIDGTVFIHGVTNFYVMQFNFSVLFICTCLLV